MERVPKLIRLLEDAEQGVFTNWEPQKDGDWGRLEALVARLMTRVRTSSGEAAVNEKELQMTRAIQKTLLPSDVPQIPGMEIGAIYQPAQEVGGDYYDFVDIDDDHVGIAIADVSGKSISGAMFMSILRNTLRSQAMMTLSPKEVLERTNDLILPNMTQGLFVSIFYAVLKKSTSELVCANAGHLPLLWYQASVKKARWIQPRGIALGLIRTGKDAIRLEEATVAMGPGDLILMYTDGITEGANVAGDRYGRERLARLAESAAVPKGKMYLSAMVHDLLAFSANMKQFDDITAVVMHRKSE